MLDVDVIIMPHPLARLMGISVKKYFTPRPPRTLMPVYHVVSAKRWLAGTETVAIRVFQTDYTGTRYNYIHTPSGVSLIVGPQISQVEVVCYRDEAGSIVFGCLIEEDLIPAYVWEMTEMVEDL